MAKRKGILASLLGALLAPPKKSRGTKLFKNPGRRDHTGRKIKGFKY